MTDKKARRNAYDRWCYKTNHLRFRDRTLARMRKHYRDDAAFRKRCKERGRVNSYRRYWRNPERERERGRRRYQAMKRGDATRVTI
jgi:hypothetical protein